MSQRSESFVNFRDGDSDKWMSDENSTDDWEVERALSSGSSHVESQAYNASSTYDSQRTVGSSPPHPSPQTNPLALQPDNDMTDEQEVAHVLSPGSSHAEIQAHNVSPAYASQQTVGSSPPHPSPQTNPLALQPDDDMTDEQEVAHVLSPGLSFAESRSRDIAPRPPQTYLLPQANSQALRRSQTFPTLSTTLQLQSEPAEEPEPAEEIVTRQSSPVAGPSTGTEEDISARRQSARKRRGTTRYPQETYVSTQTNPHGLHRSQTLPTLLTALPESVGDVATRPVSPEAGPSSGTAEGVTAREQGSSKRKRINAPPNYLAPRPSQRKEIMYNRAVNSNGTLLRQNSILQEFNESLRREGMALYSDLSTRTQQLQEETMALHAANAGLQNQLKGMEVS